MVKRKSKIAPKMSDFELSRFLRAYADDFGSVKMHLLVLSGEVEKGNRALAKKVILQEIKFLRYAVEVLEQAVKDG